MVGTILESRIVGIRRIDEGSHWVKFEKGQLLNRFLDSNLRCHLVENSIRNCITHDVSKIRSGLLFLRFSP